MSTAPLFVFAALVGMRHALEPDHLAAISTLVSEQGNARSAVKLGAAWGLGHTAALLGVATALALVQAPMPGPVALALELAVAAMLVVLGLRAIVRAAADARRGEARAHRHGSLFHVHADPPGGHLHVGSRTFALRSLVVGLVHGLAGSGSLTAIVASQLASVPARLGYVALFGAGSIVGMAALSGLAGLPLARIGRAPAGRSLLGATTGALALSLGLLWSWNGVRTLVG